MFARFLLVGGLGFLVDVGLTQLLIMFEVVPVLARPPAIAAAMLVTWLANRHFTFAVRTKRSLHEVVRYVLVALATALVNYWIYYFLVTNGTVPVIAITVATAFQAVLSFFGYRFFAFRNRTPR